MLQIDILKGLPQLLICLVIANSHDEETKLEHSYNTKPKKLHSIQAQQTI